MARRTPRSRMSEQLSSDNARARHSRVIPLRRGAPESAYLGSEVAAGDSTTSIQTRGADPTELRLDYKDLAAGPLVIVIHGLPTADHEALTLDAGGPRTASATGSNRDRGHGSPSSPLIDEAWAIREATGYAPALFTPLLLSAWRGREVLALELITATIEEASVQDVGRATALTDYAKAVLYNGLGRYQDAVVAAQRACAQEDLDLFSWARLELVEAGARSDARAVAADTVRHLEERTRAGTDWELGVWARSAALLSDSTAAETLYREAIERFDRGRVAVQRARAQLVYGEWLRRENRRLEAREQLRAAHETFSGIGAEAFAERARRERLATGETARRRSDETRDVLTPQEAQIASLARDGFSNPEIGSQLFISPRTVQYHLRKVFRKLDITSRNHLGRIP
ncbi:MAG TPA: LuxR C-terminal-related transcriptional regulator, partial [Gaiellaceae bacterium]|nr:LuxR C-terminal-related transcriptional regulator [Gaiellaceae bacterium]